MSEKVKYELVDRVARVTLDDGKANALSHEVIDALRGCLDRAAAEAGAVLLVGRANRFSAGFDLSVMTKSAENARDLVLAGAELLLHLYLYPLPSIAACTGHALAAGALLLLASDTRIGAAGDFKIGLNEVAIQLTLPTFGVELARERLSKRHFSAATMQARIYDPEAAVDAGYLDRIVPPETLAQAAMSDAQRLATLSQPAYAATKQRCRNEMVQQVRANLARDVAQMMGLEAGC
jgi:enoyl-CoA hydratase/carnithine racemase